MKQQAEQGNTQNMQCEEKSTRKWNAAKSCAQNDEKFKEKPGVKWNKGSAGLRERPQPAKLPGCEQRRKLRTEI